MSVDRWLGKRYHPSKYNCAHFAADVWAHETGQDIAHILSGFMVGTAGREVSPSIRHGVRALPEPVSPCLVLFRRPKTAPHVGVYLRGRVLHITEIGVRFQPLDIARLGYRALNFYGYGNHCDKPD